MNSLKTIVLTMLLTGAAIFAVSAPLYHFRAGNLLAPALPPETKADAVMVFTGASERLQKGYQAYLQGVGEKIMVTGRDFPKDARAPMVRALSKKIRRDDIYVDLDAKNTIENAKHAAEWAKKQDVDSIVLITSEGHMPRAYFELRRLLPDHVKVYTNPVPGTLNYSGVDSETGRLLCRMYETVTEASFCYKAREIARNMGL
jgi:uncharacterized SAM-binding protein YcdF (DUF218 family)